MFELFYVLEAVCTNKPEGYLLSVERLNTVPCDACAVQDRFLCPGGSRGKESPQQLRPADARCAWEGTRCFGSGSTHRACTYADEKPRPLPNRSATDECNDLQ